SGSAQAAPRSRAMTDTPRNASTWTGEALSQATRASDCRSSSGPSSFRTNHCAACSVGEARSCSSLEIMESTQPRHAAATVNQSLFDVLLRHLRRYPESDRDFPVGEAIREAQRHGRLALGTQLLEHCA